MSKVETLRSAARYIKQLKEMLNEFSASDIDDINGKQSDYDIMNSIAGNNKSQNGCEEISSNTKGNSSVVSFREDYAPEQFNANSKNAISDEEPCNDSILSINENNVDNIFENYPIYSNTRSTTSEMSQFRPQINQSLYSPMSSTCSESSVESTSSCQPEQNVLPALSLWF